MNLLRSGDSIILALPYLGSEEQADQTAKNLSKIFNSFGVEVAATMHDESSHGPSILAVFRNE